MQSLKELVSTELVLPKTEDNVKQKKQKVTEKGMKR